MFTYALPFLFFYPPVSLPLSSALSFSLLTPFSFSLLYPCYLSLSPSSPTLLSFLFSLLTCLFLFAHLSLVLPPSPALLSQSLSSPFPRLSFSLLFPPPPHSLLLLSLSFSLFNSFSFFRLPYFPISTFLSAHFSPFLFPSYVSHSSSPSPYSLLPYLAATGPTDVLSNLITPFIVR